MRQTCIVLSFALAAISNASVNAICANFPQTILSALQQNGQNQIPITPSATVSRYWLDEQDHTGTARGFAPFLGTDYTYPVYRNVRAYGAVGDGQHDDTNAFQNAINNDGNGGNRYKNEVTTRPAEVFVPGGEYRISKTVDLRLNTILVGDPNDPPVFKASPEFSGGSLINGVDFATDGTSGTTNFLVSVKNVVIDTTEIDKDKGIFALNWGVAQACQLTNTKINMPNNSNGHVGIAVDQGSTTAVTDVTIVGGAIGIRSGNQQVNFKDISFRFCTTAITFTGGFTAIIQGARFDTCGLGVDATRGGQLGSVVILDSNSISSGPVIKFHDSSRDNGPRSNQVVIENLSHAGSNPVAVASDGSVKLQRIDPAKIWIWGNVDPGNFRTGTVLTSSRSGKLLSNGKFFTKAQPAYKGFSKDQIVNVKAVGGHPVKGDGTTDDSVSLNAILADSAARGKVSYFPYGVYIVKCTLHIPPGSRIVGEAWPVISGLGGYFGDRKNPQAVVMVGKPGQTGIAQIQDMRFSVADIAPGAIILQVNMAGSAQGDVGIWNSHITVGGTADTNVNKACDGPNTAACLAAFAMLHLTKFSSCYIDNMWGWTADHSLERGGHQNIATGRGALIESTQGTWLTGTAFEHNTLYNYNLHKAENVYIGMQQSETAYWQGVGSLQDAPDPWPPLSSYGDPDFGWCARRDQSCRMGLAQHIDGGVNLHIYASAFWTFFHGEVSTCYNCPATVCGPNCIKNQARVTNNPRGLWWYGVNTRNADVMVLDGRGDPKQYNNPGGWTPGGVIAGYLLFSGAAV